MHTVMASTSTTTAAPIAAAAASSAGAAASSLKTANINTNSEKNKQASSSSSSSSSSSAAAAAAKAKAAREEKTKVAVRMRPLNPREKRSSNHGRVWKVDAALNRILETTADGIHEAGHDPFQYAHAFDESSTTAQVYDCVAGPIVSDVLRGYNGTVFAYGQTASGKTFTMQGDDDDDDGSAEEGEEQQNNGGILRMAANDIFDHIAKEKGSDRKYMVRASFIEIYNEDVRDLLAPSRDDSKLVVRGPDKKKGFFVSSIEKVVTTRKELLTVLAEGEKNRSVGSTEMNERSSRSHTIFKIDVESSGIDVICNGEDGSGGRVRQNDESVTTISTLNLVDLAGSESVKHTGATGDRQKEGGKINQSLLHLSNVITALGQNAARADDNNNQQPQQHVNYRDSNLTKILKPSLSGNAKLAVICCATPSELYSEETRTTLQFANRAQMIKTKAARKVRRPLAEASGARKSKASFATPVTKRTPHRKGKRHALSPKRPLANPRCSLRGLASGRKRYPQTEVKAGGGRGGKRFSVISERNDAIGTPPQHDAMAVKDATVAALEKELEATRSELQHSKNKVRSQEEEMHWIRSANQELQLQIASLVADKEFIEAENQVHLVKQGINGNHAVSSTKKDNDSPLFEMSSISRDTESPTRRESSDSNLTIKSNYSDATEVFVLGSAIKRSASADSAGGDSYDDIVEEFRNAMERVVDLERRVTQLQLENYTLKRVNGQAKNSSDGKSTLLATMTVNEEDAGASHIIAEVAHTGCGIREDEKSLSAQAQDDEVLLSGPKNLWPSSDNDTVCFSSGGDLLADELPATGKIGSVAMDRQDEVAEMSARDEHLEDGDAAAGEMHDQERKCVPRAGEGVKDEMLGTDQQKVLMTNDEKKASERPDELVKEAALTPLQEAATSRSDSEIEICLPCADEETKHESKVEQLMAINDENTTPNQPNKPSKEAHVANAKQSSPLRRPLASKKRSPLGKATKENIRYPRRSTRSRASKKPTRFSPSSDKSTTSVLRTSTSCQPTESDFRAEFGERGYEFYKNFGSHWGIYYGVVEKVLSDGNRFCNYPDDESKRGKEILTLEELPKPSKRWKSYDETRKRRSAAETDIVDLCTPIKEVDVPDEDTATAEEGEEDLTIYRNEVSRRAKTASQNAVAEMIQRGEEALWKGSATCHICKNRRDSCLTFHCGKHKYCDRHCKERLGFDLSEYDPTKPGKMPIGYCPICSLSCECSKCTRKLDFVAKDMKINCQAQTCQPIHVKMNSLCGFGGNAVKAKD